MRQMSVLLSVQKFAHLTRQASSQKRIEDESRFRQSAEPPNQEKSKVQILLRKIRHQVITQAATDFDF